MAPSWIKNFTNPKDLYEAQSILFKFSFILGITPFQVFNTGPPILRNVLKCTLFGYMNATIHIIVFAICYVISLMNNRSIPGYLFKADIGTLGNNLQLANGLVLAIMTFIYMVIKRDKLIKANYTLSLADDLMKEVGIEIDYKRTFWHILYILTAKIVCYFTYMSILLGIFSCANVYPSFYTWMAFIMPHNMISMVLLLFVCITCQIKSRLICLNKVK